MDGWMTEGWMCCCFSRDRKQERSGCRSVVRQWVATYAKSRYQHGDLTGTLRGLGGLAHRGGVGGWDDGAVISHGESVGLYL